MRLREGKCRPRGSVPGGCSATSRPSLAMRSWRSLCCGRMGDVDPARDHPDARRERAFMRRPVDPACEARDDGEARLGQSRAEIARQLYCRRAGITRTSQRDAGRVPQYQPPAAGHNRRGRNEFCQQRWVIALIVEQVARARLAHRGDLALDALRAGGAVWPPAPAGEIGQRIERPARSPEAREQLAIADRPDVGRAQQADAREGFWLREHRLRPHLLHQMIAPVMSWQGRRSSAPPPASAARYWRGAGK